MIPVKSALEEQAWLLIDNSCSLSDDKHESDEITNVKFRFRPLELAKIDPSTIDHQDQIRRVILSDNLWLLRMELVVLSKRPIESSPEYVFHKHLVIMDDEGFTFKPVYDPHLCWSMSSEFATRNGLANFYGTELFNPKIRYKAAMLFELPDDAEDLFFASTYCEIKEA